MNAFAHLILGLTKGLLYSLIVGVFGFIVTVSLINNRFPPTLNDIKTVKTRLTALADLRKDSLVGALGGGGGEASSDRRGGRSAKPVGRADSSGYTDPEMSDFEEVREHYKKQSNLSRELLEGEMTFASNPPPSEEEQQQKRQREFELEVRVKRLEDLILQLQGQIRYFGEQLNSSRNSKNPRY